MANQDDKKVIQLSDEDLINGGFLGDGALESVKSTIETTRANPELLGDLTWFMLECKSFSAQGALKSPTSPALNNATGLLSQHSIGWDVHTVVAPHLVSEFERVHYWHGISADPPELLYRSDLESNPFPVPRPGTRWFELPEKTAEGVFGTSLNLVWNIVAPMIVSAMKARGIKHSALKAARFSTRGEDGRKTLGPIVIWIATHPGTTTAEDARDASPAILDILEDHNVQGVVVEWYEGSVEKLVGPPLMRIADETNPTHYVRRALTAAVGMPVATLERRNEYVQGTVSFFFHENKTKQGEPSARVLAVSNKHVLRANTTRDCRFMGPGTPRRYVQVCGIPRFQRLFDETTLSVTKNVDEAVRLVEEIARLKAKPKSENSEQVEEDEEALELKKDQLNKVNKDNGRLQNFYKELSQWSDFARRTIGFVDWAPRISTDVDDHHYTRDIGTVELDARKFKDNFQGNVVDLANQSTRHELNKIFWPNDSNQSGIKFPSNRQLRIQGVVPRELLANPDCYDENGNPIYIVGKVGNTTDFTAGRYSGLEAYLCDKFGNESIEIAVYNYSKTSGNFSQKGDSGSLIFTGSGRMLAILHSGMPKGQSNHVTYGTPAWWAIEQLKAQYPHADFDRTTFSA